MWPLAILTLVCALTYAFEIVFGLGGTVMMIPLLVFWFDAKTLVVYSTLPQVAVAAIGLGRSTARVDRRQFLPMLVFAALGFVAGLALFELLSSRTFQYLLASAFLVFGALLWLPPRRQRLRTPVRAALDVLAGASQALFGISGPVAVTRLLATIGDKTLVRHYALAFFLVLNLARAGGYVVSGAFTHEVLIMMAVSAPVLLPVLWFAERLHPHVNERWYRRTVSLIVVAGGVSLFFRT